MKSCIGLVITNIEETVVTTLPSVGNSDHVTLLVSVYDSFVYNAKAQRDVWCWSKVDMEQLREGIRSANWFKVLESTNVDTAWMA